MHMSASIDPIPSPLLSSVYSLHIDENAYTSALHQRKEVTHAPSLRFEYALFIRFYFHSLRLLYFFYVFAPFCFCFISLFP